LLVDGTPAAGVKLVGVYLHESLPHHPSSTPEFSATTDADGKFAAPKTLETMYLYGQTTDGKQQGVIELDADVQALETPLVLKPTGSATGRIVDLQGNPIPNVEFTYGMLLYTLVDGDNWSDTRRNFPQRIRAPLRFGGTGKSDAEGRFRIDGVVVGQDFYVVYRVSQEAHNYGGNDTFQLAKFRLDDVDTVHNLGDCRINPASLAGWKPSDEAAPAKFTARFLDDKTGEPIANQRVDIRWALWTEEDRKRVEETTKKLEERQTKIAEVRERIKEANEGATEEMLNKMVAERISELGLMSNTMTFSSRDFEPRPFTGEYPNTDADGRIEFTFPKLAAVHDPSDICLMISCFSSFPAGENWSLAPYLVFREQIQGPFEPTQDYTFRLIPYDHVIGKVVDPDGKPIARATLEIMTSRNPSPGDHRWNMAHKQMTVQTDDDGVFRAMVAPGFTQGQLQLNAPGGIPRRVDLKDYEGDWTFTIERGTDVTGRVVDTEGNGIADVWVNFSRRGTHVMVNDPLGRSVRTGNDGRFVAPSLGKEEYSVSVSPLPMAPNVEGIAPVRLSSAQSFPAFEKYVFANSTIDLRTDEPPPPPPLTITGHPTVALKFVWTDETPEKEALFYSRLSFHGRFHDTEEYWNIQAEGAFNHVTRTQSGTVHLPKGVPFSLSFSMIDSYIRDGVRDIKREKRENWTLEYRFGSEGDWKSCTETKQREGFSLHSYFGASLEAQTGVEGTLEIRVR
jgi:hypothetical protein